jgi:hypothetical protein
MLRGYVDEIYATRVTGWAMEEADPQRTLRVDIEVDGVCVASPLADRLRPDLEKNFGNGHHGFAYEFNTPLPVVRDHHVRILFSGTEQIVSMGERHLKAVTIPPAPPGSLLPILVSASGRAGSTILMQRLARHPAISVANLYPYETELLKYYGHAFSVLSSIGDHAQSGQPDTFINNFRFVGANPYFIPSFAHAFTDRQRFSGFYEDVAPRALARTFRDLVTAFYDSAAADAGKTGAVYFAEKSHLAGTARMFSRNIYGAVKEIVLVRDLRDTLCSFRSFWSQPQAEAMRLLAISYTAIMNVFREGRSDVMFVKYEDLVANEQATLAAIAAFLGIAAFPPVDPETDKALFDRHATSASPAASIGRWKRDLSAAEIALTTEKFAPLLRAFGYEI